MTEPELVGWTVCNRTGTCDVARRPRLASGSIPALAIPARPMRMVHLARWPKRF